MPKLVTAIFAATLSLCAASIDQPAIERDLQAIAAAVDGRLGACVSDGKQIACVRGAERFSLQSVVKLVVGVAVLHAVDANRWRLDERVTLHRSDMSLAVQPIADLVGNGSYTTTIGDLVNRAIVDSDSAANDYLMGRLGGPPAIQKTLAALRIDGIRVDRDERHLQTEIVGLTWRSEYVDPKVLKAAMAALDPAARTRAYEAYQKDVRDTATPQAMVTFLVRLQAGKLLSPTSTAFILRAMANCATFPDRLKAGAPANWQVAHKTGTSGSWNGVTAATNDVAILASPAGSKIAVVVFVADSRAPLPARAAAMAKVAATAVNHFHE